MRLCRRVKFHMIIAILLCMAFVVNIGVTLASVNYIFTANSINKVELDTSLNNDAYINFASMQGTKGEYIYSPGTYNNQLSVNYGFNTKYNYDLMIKFTIEYEDDNHNANDFTINFVDRDNWCVDMGTINQWKTQDNKLVEDTDAGKAPYYINGSSTSSMSGVMYYMNTINGSGNLPVISSVTFHTSLNNSYQYIGDKLTITLTPEYAVSSVANYGAGHKFYPSNEKQVTAFNNWATYMKATKDNSITEWDTSVMIYNSYVDSERSLAYPYDSEVVDENGIVKTDLFNQPNYSNTAYKYRIIKTTDQETGVTTTRRSYDSITAGNRYSGGLGVYVLPGHDLITISVSFGYNWYSWENQQLSGPTNIGMVKFEYSNEIQTIVTTNGQNEVNRHYYRGTIDKPTYVNVLDYIRLTAEGNSDIIKGGYTLLLNNISIGLITTSNQSTEIKTDVKDPTNVWTGEYSKPVYTISNATETSSILARVKDVAAGSKDYDTNVAITNNSATTMKITGFTINSKLWYGNYYNANSSFTETIMSTLPANGLKFDSNIWNVSSNAGVFTFTLVGGKSVHIPSGYSLTLINGITIPATIECQTETEANDFWCTLEVESVVVSTENIDYTQTTGTSVEVMADGYYSAINSNKPGYIYIRNNSRQVITKVNISGLQVSILDSESQLNVRDRITANDASHNLINCLADKVSIKPGEMVLAYTIEITSTTIEAVIRKFDISVNFATKLVNETVVSLGEESSDIDLIYNATTQIGMLTNNSSKNYEFRLVSTTDLSNVLANPQDFVEQEKGANLYYYYYKGIICANRSVQLLNNYAVNVEIEYLEHNSSADAEYYVADNYQAWNGVENSTWFSAMKKLFEEPSAADRVGASVVA